MCYHVLPYVTKCCHVLPGATTVHAPVAIMPAQPAMEEEAFVMPKRMPEYRGAMSWWLLPRPAAWKPPSASAPDSSATAVTRLCPSPATQQLRLSKRLFIAVVDTRKRKRGRTYISYKGNDPTRPMLKYKVGAPYMRSEAAASSGYREAQGICFRPFRP